MHRTTVNGEKVQVGEFKKITRLDPMLYGKDYKVEAATFLSKYFNSVKLLFSGLQ